jgi:hypothetical protein
MAPQFLAEVTETLTTKGTEDHEGFDFEVSVFPSEPDFTPSVIEEWSGW